MRYEGKTIVVTGASVGIGRALCLALAPQRPNLVLASRDQAKLEEVEALCRGLGAQTLVVPTDVGVEADCRALVERAVAHFGRLDVLVNNAGLSMWARFDELQDLSIYERIMRVNYLGCVWLTHAALPHLKRSRGQVVVIGSLLGLTGAPTRTGYAASKHALMGFYDSLRIELVGTGVDITMVAPDFVVTEIHKRSEGADGRPLGDTPMQESKIMTAEACADMILRGMEGRRRLVIGSLRGKLGRFVRIFAPGVIDRVALRAIQRGR
jgi:NAD(P)-dependent dehydrogenase (short-subunit alcohol dehydrogenase family)